jgi:signal transduction histidine kinase
LRGRRIDEFFSARVIEKVRAARQRVLAERVEEDFEFDLHVRGEARAAHARILPLVGNEVVMVIQDISERKMTERALRETKDFAESMLTARTEAFARLSHDLRNQMTGVLTITDLLLARSGQPVVRNYIETIQRCGDHIVELVSNMMELSRIERGSISLHPSDLDVHDLVEECVVLARTLATPKTTVSFQCLPGSPDTTQPSSRRRAPSWWRSARPVPPASASTCATPDPASLPRRCHASSTPTSRCTIRHARTRARPAAVSASPSCCS